MVLTMRSIVFILVLLVLLFTLAYPSPAYGLPAGITSVEYIVFYDPTEGVGTLRVTVSMTPDASQQAFSIPDLPVKVFSDASLELLNYTGYPATGYLLVEYNDTTGYASITAVNVSSVTMYFSVSNLTEEVSVGSYTATLDLTEYSGSGISPSVEMYLLGVYNATVDSYPRAADYSIQVANNMTIIKASSPAVYFIVLTVPITTPGVPPAPAQPINLLIVALVIAAVSAVAIILYLILRRPKSIGGVEPADVLNDPVSRSIIRILGEAGGEGLTQAEITNRTGAPKSSVSRRIKRLEEEGYIAVDRTGKYNYLKLTDKGVEAYRKIAGKK
ncbi:helix-turn-helix transcriptional regulator [Desulfurococcus mucosus]|uniref:Regulatory protein IclR n=1 Tax=Desulfurococcus mucosus (strain ATCC 35584 / DSM 2162 / JCM 9187 / O7/1) TaxID=765177 RepID=E8R9Q2_DESM0|nr:MarR family transcriptional regulator [Desulfurococcus mucosus]ADV65228.1 regulatory protein IclR [Desulfurococcus mucosus DSM 2162]